MKGREYTAKDVEELTTFTSLLTVQHTVERTVKQIDEYQCLEMSKIIELDRIRADLVLIWIKANNKLGNIWVS